MRRRRFKRKPYLATLLSVAMPGLGQIYLGQGELGAFLYLLPNLVILLCFFFTNATGVLLSMLFLFSVYFYASLKAYYDAKAGRFPAGRRWYQQRMVYLALWGLHLFFTLQLTTPRSYLGSFVVVRAIKATNIGMEPAILQGDLMFTYHKPFTQQKLEYGDLVVVRAPPPNGRLHVRRVVGLPGDSLRLHEGEIYRNGERLPLVFMTNPPPFARPGYQYYEETQSGRAVYVSHLLGGSHRSGSWEIPRHHYFLMADRRFLFPDSVTWGPVSEEAIIGEVQFLIWPSESMSRFGPLRFPSPSNHQRTSLESKD